MNAYLGLVPESKRERRKNQGRAYQSGIEEVDPNTFKPVRLPCSKLFSYFLKYYADLSEKRGVGRARVAMMRKICGVMRRMLLTGECYRWMDSEYFEQKLKRYEREVEKSKGEKKVA